MFIAFAVDYEESDIRNVRAIILGPPDTPYQFGLFEVSYYHVCYGRHSADFGITVHDQVRKRFAKPAANNRRICSKTNQVLSRLPCASPERKGRNHQFRFL